MLYQMRCHGCGLRTGLHATEGGTVHSWNVTQRGEGYLSEADLSAITAEFETAIESDVDALRQTGATLIAEIRRLTAERDAAAQALERMSVAFGRMEQLRTIAVEERDSLKAELAEQRDRCKLELKNFLDAFDLYFGYRGGFNVSPWKVDDAKQAMFSAAIQARAALAAGKETT